MMASTRRGIKIGKKAHAFENFSKLFSPKLKGLKINWFASREITKPTEVLKPRSKRDLSFFYTARCSMLVGDCSRSSVIFVVSFFHLQSSDSGLLHRGSCKFHYFLVMFNVRFLIWNEISFKIRKYSNFR